MPVAPAAAEVLNALLGVLSRWGPWYLFGAQAVVAYGVPRLSADVDVTLKLTPDAPLDISGLQIPTLHPERLMVAKLLAGRPKDLEDARGLWRTRDSEMDAARISRNLRLLEEALAQSDLLPAFESLRREG